MSKKNRERDLTNPAAVLRDVAEQAGAPVDEASFAAAEAYCDAPVTDTELGAHPDRPRSVGLRNGESSEVEIHLTIPAHPAAQTVKTMVQQSEQRVYRCVYDEQALARKVPVADRDPDTFCPVCGNRMVRER